VNDPDEPTGPNEANSKPGTADHEQDDDSPGPQLLATVLEQFRPALLSVPLLTLLTGVVFPLALAALAVPLFPR
jgi:hypothetical protein